MIGLIFIGTSLAGNGLYEGGRDTGLAGQMTPQARTLMGVSIGLLIVLISGYFLMKTYRALQQHKQSQRP